MSPKRSMLWLSSSHLVPEPVRGLASNWQIQCFNLHQRPPDKARLKNNASVGLLDLATLPLPLPELAQSWVERFPGVAWVAVTSTPAPSGWVGAFISAYCVDFHNAPLDTDRLSNMLGHLWGMASLKRSLYQPAATFSDDNPLIGDSPEVRQVRHTLRRYATINEPVLICGESGTGKESAARFIHRHSPASGGPLVVINCAAIPVSLTHSELFGHEKGSFTHALASRAGRVEAADGGTLVLSGIDEFAPEQQSALLRFLTTGEVERIGSQRSITVRVRVVATSTHSLEQQVQAGRFRSDVFYRLGGCSVYMPPLRERKADLPDLVEALLKDLRQGGGKIPELSEGAIQALYRHHWPGNLRELRNRLRRALLMGDGQNLNEHDLMLAVPGVTPSVSNVLSLSEYRAQAELDALTSSLSFCRQNVSSAARLLKISRVSLYRLMARHGLSNGDRITLSDKQS